MTAGTQRRRRLCDVDVDIDIDRSTLEQYATANQNKSTTKFPEYWVRDYLQYTWEVREEQRREETGGNDADPQGTTV